ncbi:hypothetical protein BSR29_04930 [Boudabousia liubingyangii]|uniref:N-acetyltransferase domain-containing protein n=1 Tax=Boudabousia liubingyangii TaxID=1921764 RepID=A0A1Q5PLB0_9ACTO|nr:GNAT family protein [Boudabousia liubingyangii]OKL47839.1 hypothetical protein BSR29_04930 [Boudabousia liubingyangii]
MDFLKRWRLGDQRQTWLVPAEYIEAATHARRLAPPPKGLRGELEFMHEIGYQPSEVALRLLVGNDHVSVQRARWHADPWLSPWNAQLPPEFKTEQPDIDQYIRECDRELLNRSGYAFAILVDGRLAGELSLFDIARRAVASGAMGYWVAPDVTGLGVMPLALALGIDVALSEFDLHRIEVNIRPENERSIGVMRKLGLRYEGRRERFLYSQGAWRDHDSFAITAEELRGTSLLERTFG